MDGLQIEEEAMETSQQEAINLSPLYIAFGQHQVAVETALPEVRAMLERWFQAMLQSQATCVVRLLAISREDGNYIMQSSESVREVLRQLLWLLQAVKHEVVMGLIDARPDLLWFHAGAVADATGAVIFAAPGGGGKSTLVTRLCQQGWRYLSDDVIPLDLATGEILPFLQTPRVRISTDIEVPPEQLPELPKTDVNLSPENLCWSPVPVKGLVFPSYDVRTPARLVPCSPGTAAMELLRNCINFANHKQVAMQRVCDLVKQLPAFGLHFSDAEAALDHLMNCLGYKFP